MNLLDQVKPKDSKPESYTLLDSNKVIHVKEKEKKRKLINQINLDIQEIKLIDILLACEDYYLLNKEFNKLKQKGLSTKFSSAFNIVQYNIKKSTLQATLDFLSEEYHKVFFEITCVIQDKEYLLRDYIFSDHINYIIPPDYKFLIHGILQFIEHKPIMIINIKENKLNNFSLYDSKYHMKIIDNKLLINQGHCTECPFNDTCTTKI